MCLNVYKMITVTLSISCDFTFAVWGGTRCNVEEIIVSQVRFYRRFIVILAVEVVLYLERKLRSL